MKRSSFFAVASIALFITYNSVVAQITIGKTINMPRYNKIFLGSANMDNDPQQELVFGHETTYYVNQLVIIDGTSGNIEWQQPSTITDLAIAGYGDDGTNYGLSPFCDVNNDGKKELIFTGEEGGITKLFIVGFQGSFSIIENNISIPEEISVKQNYPNPFNPTTTIEYQIQKSDFVTIKVFNSIGQLVNTLVNESKQSGEYSVIFNGRNESGQTVASGVYYYQLQVGDFVSSKKMILLK